jgi:catechol 2,3-dioxygenase-like lactoylglutathione lyase family enzyme
MAVNAASGREIRRLARFGLTTNNAIDLAAFYESAFGFRRLMSARLGGADFERLMDVQGGALGITLGLGEDVVDLVQFDRAGRPYPIGTSSSDLIFQHFAIVVADMDRAYRRLSSVAGWSAISSAGPRRLPETSGGVAAFKFRDPEGHPLELLAFPPDRTPRRWRNGPGGNLYLGIDHSAISVADTRRSVAFYLGLGLQVSARSLNRGPEQARLDGLLNPRVEVTALSPSRATPHVELLCYGPTAANRGAAPQGNDVAATRLTFEMSARSRAEADGIAEQALTDPDGHHLIIVNSLSG